MGLLTSKKEIEQLVNENNELKQKLEKALSFNTSLEDLEFKLIVARKEISDLNQKEFEQSNKLKDLDEEITHKVSSISRLESELSVLEIAKDDVNNQIHELQKYLEQININIESKNQEYLDFESGESEITKAIKEKQIELNSLAESIENYIKEKDYLVNEIAGLQENIHYLREENKDIDNKYSLIKNEYGELLKANDDLRIKINSATIELKELEKSIIRKQDSETLLNESINILSQDEELKKKYLKDLEDKIFVSEEIKQSIEESLSGLIKQLAEKDALYEEYLRKRDSVADEIFEKKKYITQFNDEIIKAETNKALLSAELLKLNNEVAEKSNLLNELENKILVSSQQLSVKENDLDNANNKLSEISSKYEEVESRKYKIEQTTLSIENSLTKTLELYNNDINDAKLKLNQIKQQILEKEIDLNNKEKSIHEKNEILSISEGQNKAMIIEKDALLAVITNLTSVKVAHEKEIEQLRQKELQIKKDLTDSIAELNSVTEKKNDLDKNIKQLFDIQLKGISNLEHKKATLLKDIEEAEQKITQ